MKNCFKKLIIMFVMVLTVLSIEIIQNGTIANAATVGEQLLQPEDGWVRYDNDDSNISVNGSWAPYSMSGLYKDNQIFTGTVNSRIEFNFVGTELRLIQPQWSDGDNNVKIEIDGITEYYSQRGIEKFQTIMYEKLGMNNGVHTVKITKITNDSSYLRFDAIDIDENGILLPYNEDIVNESLNLNESFITLSEGTSEILNPTMISTVHTNKDLIWTSSNEEIAKVDQNGNVNAIKEGKAVITVQIKDTYIKATCNVTVTKKEEVKPEEPEITSAKILNVDPEKDKIKLKENVTADIVIDNIKEIAAEDMLIKYDSTKLKFINTNEVNGIKLVKKDEKDGELRVILASKGLANIVNDKKVLLKLNFQGISPGEALVNITKGKISDGIEMEKDLIKDQCGEAKIIIEDETFLDVNNDGVFTLLDLAIDARHYGEDTSSLPQYNTDIVINQAIDNDDLLKIGEYMLANPEYKLK